MEREVRRVLRKKDLFTVVTGNCIDTMKYIPDNSVDSVVTDPPYGLSKQPDIVEVMRHWVNGDTYQHKGTGFMGKTWDSFVPGPDYWKEVFRILKPGGHALVFAGTRTHDLMSISLRFAGFEIRDTIAWVYGSGFPKSLDVSKAIDKAAGAEREVLRFRHDVAKKSTSFTQERSDAAAGMYSGSTKYPDGVPVTTPATPATPEAQQWQGWGTALKPALEPITVARKPIRGTVAANVLQHGTGAINVDGCRVEANGEKTGGNGYIGLQQDRGWNANNMPYKREQEQSTTQGRWPANLIHDGSDEVVRLFPHTGASPKVTREKNSNAPQTNNAYGKYSDDGRVINGHGDSGSAARFFYCLKSSKHDRNEGLPEGLTSSHPTVKPTKLMQYLVRLVTPPQGVVCDPFTGSGSTGKAAIAEGFYFIGCELEEEYTEIANYRIQFEVDKISDKGKAENV